jgi:endonuclease/exonuclease/phosphatase (EEP) superfamily protein YafD
MADAGPVRRWAGRLAVAATAIAVVGVVACWLVALVPVWPCALLEHFRVQYVAGAAVVVGCAAGLRMAGWFDAAVIAAMLHALWLAPDVCRAARPLPPDGARVRVLVLNVLTENASFDEVRALIDEVRPDVVGLVEVDQRWVAGVAPAVADFAGRLERPRGDNFGVALYTRVALAGAIEQLGADLPAAVASITVGGARLGVILVHPPPPVSAMALDAQRQELDAVADRARAMPQPVIVIGDLNATPWSRPFRRLIVRSGLCDSRAGFGIQASFPAASRVLRIPIDHLIVSCEVGVADRRVEREVGSDHLPLVIDLVVPRPR